jgi:hypothetical protein
MTTAQWNLLVYAIAEDAREHDRVLAEIEDMRAAATSDQVNVVVQVMARRRTTRYWIAAPHRAVTETLADPVDASRPTALTGFLNAAARRHPAAATALVLRAHGSGLDHVHDTPRVADGLSWPGPTRLELDPPRRPESYGCRWGPDPNSGQFLTNVTMKRAIAASLRGCVDVLALNACWMATLEIEYELRNVASVEVASQVNAKPWSYGALVQALARRPSQPPDQLARAILASVEADLDRRKDAVSAFRAGAAMDTLAAAFEVFARRATALVATDWDGVHDAVMTQAQRIDDPLQVDLASLVGVLGDGDPLARAAADAVVSQLEIMRIGSVAHASHPGVRGLSIFCPRSTRIDLADAYQGTEFRSHSWATFLLRFQRRLASS